MNDPTTITTLDADATRRYLLGMLAEPERDLFEARLLSDRAAYEQVLAGEEELIDEYVGGELPPTDRRAFEARLLTLDRVRERVGFARTLRALGDEPDSLEAAASHDEAVGWRERIAAFLGLGGFSPSPAFATAMAAALVVLLGVSGFLGWRAADLTGRVESLQARATASEAALGQARAQQAVVETGAASSPATEPAEPADETPETPTGAEPAAITESAELLDERTRAARLAERVAELESRPVAPPRVTAVFILSLATRSTSGVREIIVPPDADTVRLQLDVGGEAAESLRARLLAAGGRVAWSATGLTSSGGRPLVVAELPAKLLTPGRYELLLEQTATGSGEPELIGAYEFQVR